MNDNRAFVSEHGYFIDGDFPTDMPASPPVDQLLGVNDHNIAVGFYNDANGNTHAYSFNINRNVVQRDHAVRDHRPDRRRRSTTTATSPGSAPTRRVTRRTGRSSHTCSAATAE